MFTSRPTPILKRDFIKWTYLSVHKIKGFKLTKLLTIGNNQEMDVFVDYKEDQKNYALIAQQYETGEIENILIFYDTKISHYKPGGKNETERSLNAMKDIGPVLIYSYYVEGFLEPKFNEEKAKMLLKLNSRVRDGGAKVIYPLYDKARDMLSKSFKNRGIDLFTLEELNKSSQKAEIERRKKFYVFLGKEKGSIVYVDPVAKKFLDKEKFIEIKAVFSKTEVTGLPTGTGTVRGEVKIIRGVKDIQNCSGKVIVSRDTIIEYTPMLKKNLAIVTDLGGISCHAVVTAREFRIPCVVGTKYATDVFKDGDLVEVDADKGTARIIKREIEK